MKRLGVSGQHCLFPTVYTKVINKFCTFDRILFNKNDGLPDMYFFSPDKFLCVMFLNHVAMYCHDLYKIDVGQAICISIQYPFVDHQLLLNLQK